MKHHKKKKLINITHPRLNFSDYSAEQQESDYNRYVKLQKNNNPHLYLLKVDGVLASVIFTPKFEPKFYENKTLIEVYNEIKEKYSNYGIRCIRNEGLEQYLRTIKKKELSINKLQRMIDFNNER